MNRKPYLFGLAIAILVILAVACGEDNAKESADPSATVATATVATATDVPVSVDPSATVATATDVPVSSTSTPPTTEGATGIPELDTVIDALRSGDADKLRPLLEFSEVSCNTDGQVGLTMCAADEEAGDLVEVFQFVVCEGQSLRRGEIDRALSVLTESELYAVYRAPEDSRFCGEYVALISAPTLSGLEDLAWEVVVQDGRIVLLAFTCSLSTEEYAEGFDNPVLPPQLP